MNSFFGLADNHYGIRGHEKRLTKVRSRLDTRKFFFSQRVVNGWNCGEWKKLRIGQSDD